MKSNFWMEWGEAGDFALRSPWWSKSGRVHAAVQAWDAEHAKRIVREAHSDPFAAESLNWRLVQARTLDWSPFGGEFRREEWMSWEPLRGRIFVDVDTQVDFCTPSGALYVPGGFEAARAVAEVLGLVAAVSDRVVQSADAHDFWSPEFAPNGGAHPPHCLKGTVGATKMPGTLLPKTVYAPLMPAGAVLPDTVRAWQGFFPPTGENADLPGSSPAARLLGTLVWPLDAEAVLFEKDSYTVFQNGLLDVYLSHLSSGYGLAPAVTDVFVTGVATEFCVREAALGFRERGYGVTLVDGAIAAVTDEGGVRAVREMREAGCVVETVQSLTDRLRVDAAARAKALSAVWQAGERHGFQL